MRPRISIRGSVRPYVRPYVHPSICPSVRMSVTINHWPYFVMGDASYCPSGLVFFSCNEKKKLSRLLLCHRGMLLSKLTCSNCLFFCCFSTTKYHYFPGWASAIVFLPTALIFRSAICILRGLAYQVRFEESRSPSEGIAVKSDEQTEGKVSFTLG